MKEQILVTNKQLKEYRRKFLIKVYPPDYFQLTHLTTKLEKGHKSADFRDLPFEKWSKEHNRIFEGESIRR